MWGAIQLASNFIKSWSGYKPDVYKPVEAESEDKSVRIRMSPTPPEPTLYDFLENYYMKYGKPWEEINIGGFRDESDMNKDVINDWIFVADSKTKKVHKFKGSTDPGVYYTNNMISAGLSGVAHIAMGHHSKVYVVGLHAGKYEAMVQRGAKITIWRDVDKDFKFTKGTDIVSTGWYGTNIHKMSDWKILEKIGRYSAGCQIINDPKDFRKFMNIIKSSNHYKKYRGGARFDYMIIPINDIPKGYL